jgi:SAM-dependent methyltransferase
MVDIGCGNGAFTEEVIARCAPAAVSAIDPSDEQLAYARARNGVKMTEFRTGDAETLPFGDATFDVAVMALVISFLPDPDKSAADCEKAIRPAGVQKAPAPVGFALLPDLFGSAKHLRRFTAKGPAERPRSRRTRDCTSLGNGRGSRRLKRSSTKETHRNRAPRALGSIQPSTRQAGCG